MTTNQTSEGSDMNDAIRPIDQSRACRIALGSVDGDDAAVNAALQEAHDEDALLAAFAAAVQSWLTTSIHFVGEAATREALQAAIFDAQLSE